MSVGWNLILPNTSFLFSAKWLHSTKMCRTVRIHCHCSHCQYIWMCQMYMTWQQSAFSLPLVPTWLGTQQKVMSLLAKLKNTHFRITIPIKGCPSFIYCKAWRHESESVKIIYVDATESLICSRALMIAQTSAVKMHAESGNPIEITVSDGKTVAQATECPSREPSV